MRADVAVERPMRLGGSRDPHTSSPWEGAKGFAEGLADVFQEALRHSWHRARREIGPGERQHLRRQAEHAPAATHVTQILQRQEGAPCAGARQSYDPRDIGKREARMLLVEGFHDRKSARECGHKRGSRLVALGSLQE
jgi:hypothetical protein